MLTGRVAEQAEAEELVVKPVGRLTVEQAPVWGLEVQTRAWKKARRILVDLSGVTYLDSAGAAFLLSLALRSRHTGKSVLFLGLPPQGLRVLKLLQVDGLLTATGTFETRRGG